MIQVAIYGKGGIGKSTASANISYLLTKKGLKIVQIGCDPKHDSTRLLLGGKTQLTILDNLSSQTPSADSDMILKGKNGVLCMETGGPEPGVGCAGRGILTAFDYIHEKSLIPEGTDMILYDVLGDVVCGGFAVPLRKQYANVVFVVTSGEFMSLYAANNVLKGIRNFDNGDRRLAGLILNSRGNDGEYEYVKNFADAVGLPIVAVIPRSGKFSTAESNGMTIAEMFPDSEEVAAYGPVVDILTDVLAGKGELHEARPLNDDDLDLVAKGIKVRPKEFAGSSRKLATDERTALRSCGIRVVSHCCLEILDSELIVHGPMSCAYYYSGGYDRKLLSDRRTDLVSSNYRSFPTCLDDNASIFGGGKMLKAKIEERVAAGAKLIFVITACVPGIIGDDTENICYDVEKNSTGVRVIPIPMDGVLCGGGIQGMNIAIERICTLMDPNVTPEDDLVNLIGYGSTNDRDLEASDDTERILAGLGLRINCKFLNRNSSQEIVEFRKARFNLMYVKNMSLIHQVNIIAKSTGMECYPEHMPRGLRQTMSWIRSMAKYLGRPGGSVDALCAELEDDYRTGMAKLRSKISGETVMIYTDTSSDLEWMLEMFENLGIEVLQIMCPTNSVWNMTEETLSITRDIPILYDMNLDGVKAEIEKRSPTFVVGANYQISSLKTPHMIIELPRAGVNGCVLQASRIVRMLEVMRYENN